MPNYLADQTFEKIDFSLETPTAKEYDHCTFINCNFANTDLSNINFNECEFTGCNMSMAKLIKTSFREAKFKHCKLFGLHFEDCNPMLFSVQFDTCQLNFSSFYKLKMKKTIFKNTVLQEVDFTATDLTGAIFKDSDLNRAKFENTLLEGADFRSAQHFILNPEQNRIKKAKFSLQGLPGLLTSYAIEVE